MVTLLEFVAAHGGPVLLLTLLLVCLLSAKLPFRWLLCSVLEWHDWAGNPFGGVAVRCRRCRCAFWQFQRDEERKSEK